MAVDVPEVSVVIPVCRGGEYVAKALSSVFAQTFTRYEVIVVNDGSPETERIEKDLLPCQQRIIYVKQPNSGPSAARNAGVLRSTGAYVAFLDADDAWYPNYLEEQLAALHADPGLDLIYCDALLIGDSPHVGQTVMEISPSRGPVTLESLLKLDCTVITSCTVARRPCLLKAGLFDEDLRCCEDYDLWVRIANCGARMSYQLKVLALRRIHSEAITADPSYVTNSQIAVFRKIGQTLPLSSAHQLVIKNHIAKCMASIEFHRSKLELMAGKYSEAAIAIRLANNYFPSNKLRTIEWIIRILPRTARLLYRARHQWYAALAHKKLSMSSRGVRSG